jgi:hypothetical protein
VLNLREAGAPRWRTASEGDPHPAMSDEHWKLDPAVYSRLLRDRSVSHGAFRFWHLLRDHAGKEKGFVGACWPKQESICAALGCDIKSLPKWRGELQAGRYLYARKVGEDHHWEYRIWDGSESPKTPNRNPDPNGGFSRGEWGICPSRMGENGDSTIKKRSHEAIPRSKGNFSEKSTYDTKSLS